MSYIGKVQIDGSANEYLIGSSLYGVCSTSAIGDTTKIINLQSFDEFIHGITIHVKFVNGNTATNGLSLSINSVVKPVSNPGGSYSWSAGSVVSFTYDSSENSGNGAWLVNDSDSGVTLTVENTYNSNSTNPISGQGVANAISGLQLGDASQRDVDDAIIDSGNDANTNANTNTNVPTTPAVAQYINSKLEGLSGALRFVGITTSVMTDESTTNQIQINSETYTAQPGDVVLYGNQEYVWIETNASTHTGYWELLGDESSYALKSDVVSVVGSASLSGSNASASVNSGILIITSGNLTLNTTSVNAVRGTGTPQSAG